MRAPARTLPVYFGNRNWHPLVEDTVAEMARDGVRRALVFATSAYGGYSACRQYHEDIARARKAVGDGAPELVKLRHFFDHPLFVAANADAVRAARARFRARSATGRAAGVHRALGAERRGRRGRARRRGRAPLLAAGGRGGPAGRRGGRGRAEYDLVWQSRSGPPQVPWLAPDIIDHLDALAAAGVAGRGRRAGRVRLRPRRGGVGPRHRGPRAGRRAGHARSPGRRRRARTRGSRTWWSSWWPSTPTPPRRAGSRRTCRPRAAP